MGTRTILATATLLASLVAATAFAQSTSGDVTFEVPVNLSRLHPDISTLAVECTAADRPDVSQNKDTPRGRREFNVTNGLGSDTLMVTVPTASRGWRLGTVVYYECRLRGLNRRSGEWREFAEKDKVGSPFLVTPTPAPIKGEFTW